MNNLLPRRIESTNRASGTVKGKTKLGGLGIVQRGQPVLLHSRKAACAGRQVGSVGDNAERAAPLRPMRLAVWYQDTMAGCSRASEPPYRTGATSSQITSVACSCRATSMSGNASDGEFEIGANQALAQIVQRSLGTPLRPRLE